MAKVDATKSTKVKKKISKKAAEKGLPKKTPVAIPGAEERELFVFEGSLTIRKVKVKVSGDSVTGAEIRIGKDGQVYGKSVMAVMSEGEETFMAVPPQATELIFTILGIKREKKSKD